VSEITTSFFKAFVGSYPTALPNPQLNDGQAKLPQNILDVQNLLVLGE
jgi:hypothetical protein